MNKQSVYIPPALFEINHQKLKIKSEKIDRNLFSKKDVEYILKLNSKYKTPKTIYTTDDFFNFLNINGALTVDANGIDYFCFVIRPLKNNYFPYKNHFDFINSKKIKILNDSLLNVEISPSKYKSDPNLPYFQNLPVENIEIDGNNLYINLNKCLNLKTLKINNPIKPIKQNSFIKLLNCPNLKEIDLTNIDITQPPTLFLENINDNCIIKFNTKQKYNKKLLESCITKTHPTGDVNKTLDISLKSIFKPNIKNDCIEITVKEFKELINTKSNIRLH